MLPNVKRIALSHNRIKKIENLEQCVFLNLLDVGFNKIDSVQDLHLTLGGLKILILRNNSLTSTSSLEKIFSLEKLDISNNLIEDVDEIKRLSALPLLVHLNTLGNPVCLSRQAARTHSKEESYRYYRREILSHFIFERSEVNDHLQFLDDEPVYAEEIQRLQISKRYLMIESSFYIF